MLGLWALTLAACQPVPHPFAVSQLPPDAPILRVSDVAGILVEPVMNAPDGGALANAMAAALLGREIPADTHASNRQSYHLLGDAAGTRVSPGSAAVAIDWTLVDAKGAVIGHDVQTAPVTAIAWTSGDPRTLRGLADAAAPRIAAMVQEVPPAERNPGRQIFIRPTEDAPGDGRTALPRALRYLLQRAGVAVTDDSQTVDAVVITPMLALTSRPGNQQHVRIVWHVYRPDGTEAGQVSQENDVPAGTLDGTWGDVSMAVATAGINQIMDVVKTIPLGR